MCTPASNAEMIIRINMATLGDPRFVPLDERTGEIAIERLADSAVLSFKRWVAQPAGEWAVYFDPCGKLHDAMAWYAHAVCPGHLPRSALIDANMARSGNGPLNWDAYELALRPGNCTDTLHLWPKSGVIHGDFWVEVTEDGQQIVSRTRGSGTPSVNGQIPRVVP